MIKAIIFDYDGVIVDSFANIFEAYQTICNALGKRMPATIEEFKKVYGRGYLEAYENLGITSKEECDKAEIIFQEETAKKSPPLFPNIGTVLQMLSKQYKLLLLSANYHHAIVKNLQKLGINKHFFDVIAQKEITCIPLDKTSEMLKTLQAEGLQPNEVISIGDRDIDYEQSKKAGINNIILVEYGWGYHKETLPHQKVLVYKPEDLLAAVQELS